MARLQSIHSRLVRSGAIALVALGLAVSAQPATAFVCLSSDGGIPLDPIFCSRWTVGFARIHSFLGSAGGQLFNGTTSWDDNVIAAANDWTALGGGFQYQVFRGGTFNEPCGRQGAGHACTDTGPEGDNPVLFSSTLCGDGFGDIIAQTTNCFDPSSANSRMVNAPVFFNSNVRWNAYDGLLQGGGIVDLRRVAVHELGHVLGLVHPDDNRQFVSAIMNRRVSDIDRLQEDDANGLRFLYSGGVPPVGVPEGAVDSCQLGRSDSRSGIGLLAFAAALLGWRRRCVPAQLAAAGEQQPQS